MQNIISGQLQKLQQKKVKISHFMSSGVGLASLSNPCIDGEEGKPREPGITNNHHQGRWDLKSPPSENISKSSSTEAEIADFFFLSFSTWRVFILISLSLSVFKAFFVCVLRYDISAQIRNLASFYLNPFKKYSELLHGVQMIVTVKDIICQIYYNHSNLFVEI